MADLLILQTDPPTGYYRGARPDNAPDRSWPRLASVGEIREELRVSGGETPSLSVAIDNGDGARTSELAWAARVGAALYRDGAILFAGRVARVTLGPVVSLEIEA